MKLIDKDALIAEIEKTRKALNLNLRHDQGVCDGLYAIQKYINTLEVMEVDLNKEIGEYLSTYWPEEKELHPFLGHIAKHFFELGLKAQGLHDGSCSIDFIHCTPVYKV